MINLIVFGLIGTTLCGVVFWLAHNTNTYNKRQRELNDSHHVPKLIDVANVTATADFKLLLEFENGERRVFDMNPLMDKKPFVRLKGSPLFMKAFVDYGTVVWPGNIDIAPETLYDRSKTLRT